MKIGCYCESPADQAALAVFAEGLLGEKPEPINMDLEAHSVPGFLGALDGVFRGVHYNSDAEGLIIVVDCDDTELHDSTHEAPGGEEKDCRLCKMRKTIAQARRRLRPRQDRPELRVAIGLTVPAIEAWYLVGKEHEVGEAAWRVGLAARRPPFTRPELKRLVYGTDRPSLEREMECAVQEAQRIVRVGLAALEAAFPDGFGPMAREVRSWVVRQPPPTAVGS